MAVSHPRRSPRRPAPPSTRSCRTSVRCSPSASTSPSVPRSRPSGAPPATERAAPGAQPRRRGAAHLYAATASPTRSRGTPTVATTAAGCSPRTTTFAGAARLRPVRLRRSRQLRVADNDDARWLVGDLRQTDRSARLRRPAAGATAPAGVDPAVRGAPVGRRAPRRGRDRPGQRRGRRTGRAHPSRAHRAPVDAPRKTTTAEIIDRRRRVRADAAAAATAEEPPRTLPQRACQAARAGEEAWPRVGAELGRDHVRRPSEG